MAFAIQWHCQQGTRTADNRDHAGIGIRGDSILAVVLDGSTSRPASGLFAQNIARQMADWFMTTSTAITAAAITEQLREIHKTLARSFRKESASYVLLYADSGRQAIVLHAGDCLLGHHGGDDRISWLTQPHTLANALSAVPYAALAKLEARHVLTRSFRSREFLVPDLSLVDLHEQALFIGTDGFWADLDPGLQRAFAEGRFSANEAERDDCSLLSISRAAANTAPGISDTHATANIYVRTARPKGQP